MGCDEPLTAYYSREVGLSGKRGITFKKDASLSGVPIPVPCGRCMGCRLEHSRQWAIRCMHERQLHDDATFLTLTYDDKHLPEGKTLVRSHPQAFLKRLRTAVSPVKFRLYGCGEYGELNLRPHYHIILFGIDFPDKKFYKNAKDGTPLYYSDFVDKYWGMGFNVLGSVTFESCAYVARYVTKKVKGPTAEAYYNGRLPEFSMFSLKPGIGAGWFDKYGPHAYEWDSVIMNGREVRPPRFYDTRYEVIDSDRLEALKSERRRKLNRADNTRKRRHVKEDLLRLNLQKREL
uniref:Replication protein VP4 n=1 Tax=Gokushovirinae environmental samples TaxID=1478972 RepID=A0A2R3UAK6_9VIRU|nr:replication protein VP4 [Gokushovirinae environmental samples]